MSVDKGKRVPKLHAAYLRRWWPHAEATPNGRNGRDILGTPGVWFEDKTGSSASALAGVRQAVKGSESNPPCGVTPTGIEHQCLEVPVVTWWPPGVWGDIDKTVAMLPTPWLMRLLQEAGYAPDPDHDDEAEYGDVSSERRQAT